MQYLIIRHPVLANRFSRVLSAGLYATKPGVPLSPGVDFMLRDHGICENFSHISRRLERRDVEKYEYVLTMSNAQRDEILKRWPSRDQLSNAERLDPETVTREDLLAKVQVLGSFGGQGVREVSVTDSINGSSWFHVGKTRIYPGYERCYRDIKAYIIDFV